MVHVLGRSHTVTKVLSRCCHLQHHRHHTFMTVHYGGHWCGTVGTLVPLGIRDTPIFKQGHSAEHELRHCGSKGPWLRSGTPCPTDTAPLGRIRQAQDLGLLFFSLVCWQVCPVLQPWLRGFLQRHASSPVGPGQAWRLCTVDTWVEGGGSLAVGAGEELRSRHPLLQSIPRSWR